MEGILSPRHCWVFMVDRRFLAGKGFQSVDLVQGADRWTRRPLFQWMAGAGVEVGIGPRFASATIAGWCGWPGLQHCIGGQESGVESAHRRRYMHSRSSLSNTFE